MKMNQSFIKTLFFLFLLSSGVVAKAQPRLSAGVRLGHEVANWMPGYGISAEYGLNKHISARLSFIKFGNSITEGESQLSPLSSSVSYKTSTYKATLNASIVDATARLFLGSNREVAAKGFYFAAGLGMVFANTTYTTPPYDQTLYSSDVKNGMKHSYADPLLAAGLGGEFKIAKNIYLGPELMLYLPVTEVNETEIAVNFGFGLFPSITARYTLFDDQPKKRKGVKGSSSSKSNNSGKSSSSKRR